MSVCDQLRSPALWCCLLAALFPFFSFMQLSILNVMGAYLATDLSLSVNDISVLSASFLYADALLLVPVGLLLDRYPIKHLLLLGIALLIMGTLSFALATTMSMMVIGRALAGFAHAFAFLGCLQVVKNCYPPRQAATMVGLTLAITFFGGVMAQTPSEWIIKAIGWRQFLEWQIVADVLIAIGVLFVFPRTAVAPIEERTSILHDLGIVAKHIQNWRLGFYICLLSVPLMLLGALWGVRYLVEAHAISSVDAATVSSMIFIGMALGCPIVGSVSDYFENRRVVMTLGALFALIMTCLLFMWVSASVFMLAVIFFLLGIFSSAQILGFPAIVDANAKTLTGAAMGLANIVIIAGIASLQLIFGALWEHAGTHTLAIYMIPVALVISIVLAWVE